MQPETQAINLLRARADTIDQIRTEFERRFRALPVTAPDAKYLSAEQEFATRLLDMQRETVSSIKRIEAKQRANSELCLAAVLVLLAVAAVAARKMGWA